MKSLSTTAAALLLMALLTACAITHKFGPYEGRVVDAETNEPIAGAVVLLEFWTERYTPGGFTSVFADAVETLTDSNGEFKIPARRLFVFRFPQRWNPNTYVTIFKSNYGCYPWHKQTSPEFIPNGTLPPQRYVTVKLPLLKTNDERRENLRNTHTIGVPLGEKANLQRMINEEREEIGLGAIPNS